jgi:hypothetical protein
MGIGDRRTSSAGNLSGKLLSRGRRWTRAIGRHAEIVDNDCGAAPRQELDVLTSDTASSPGDHSDAAVKSELVHRHAVSAMRRLVPPMAPTPNGALQSSWRSTLAPDTVMRRSWFLLAVIRFTRMPDLTKLQVQ